jgi:VanZ family protein
MYPLRWRRWWLAAGFLLALGVTLLSLMPSPPVVSGHDKFSHLSAYGALALWFSGIYQPDRYGWLLLGLFALGVVIEILQGLGGHRQPEIADAAANLIGIVIGLGLGRVALAGWCVRAERLIAGEGGGGD